MLKLIAVFVAGCLAGGISVGAIYHNNLRAANALIAQAQADAAKARAVATAGVAGLRAL